jgi:hypothetical protein
MNKLLMIYFDDSLRKYVFIQPKYNHIPNQNYAHFYFRDEKKCIEKVEELNSEFEKILQTNNDIERAGKRQEYHHLYYNDRFGVTSSTDHYFKFENRNFEMKNYFHSWADAEEFALKLNKSEEKILKG